MQINLRIFVIVFALILAYTTIKVLKKGRIPEKYSLIWLTISLVIFLVGLTPDFLTSISKLLGFEVMSNMVIAIILVMMVFMMMILSIMLAGQKKKTTLLIQELSILRKELNDKTK